ncbi:MAG: iron-sulfur cluster assembly scaffold protein [Candidatus Paceibacterota bacterium]|jgi:nitrogen fixation NifU-like protein
MVKSYYSKEVLKHFNAPHNYGKIKNYDGLGKVGNVICGDEMWLYVKIGKNKAGEEIIKDVKFETFGCVAAIATSSVVTDLVKGKTIEQSLKVTKEDIVKVLGELPPIKLHCSVLAIDALSEAVYNYFSKKKIKISKEIENRHQLILKREATHEH